MPQWRSGQDPLWAKLGKALCRSRGLSCLQGQMQVVYENEHPETGSGLARTSHGPSVILLCALLFPRSLSLAPKGIDNDSAELFQYTSLCFRQSTLSTLSYVIFITTLEVLILEKTEIWWDWMTCPGLHSPVAMQGVGVGLTNSELRFWARHSTNPTMMLITDLSGWAFSTCQALGWHTFFIKWDFQNCNYPHFTHEEIGSWVMSPTHYVLVTNFWITNYTNQGGLAQQTFIISHFLWAGIPQ